MKKVQEGVVDVVLGFVGLWPVRTALRVVLLPVSWVLRRREERLFCKFFYGYAVSPARRRIGDVTAIDPDERFMLYWFWITFGIVLPFCGVVFSCMVWWPWGAFSFIPGALLFWTMGWLGSEAATDPFEGMNIFARALWRMVIWG